MKEWTSYSLEDLGAIATNLLSELQDQKVVVFVGKMGAGKTTFIKTLSRTLGTEDDISSPTFSLVNEYHCPDQKIYHFDFYRIEKESEAYDMGFEEYLESGQFCFIEWPDRVENLLPEQFALVNITETEGVRKITLDLVQ